MDPSKTPWQAQVELAAAILRVDEVARELDGVLAPGHLGNSALGAVVASIFKLRKKYHTAPTEGQILEDIRQLDGLIRDSAVSLLPKLFEIAPPPTDWAIETARNMVANVELRQLAAEIPRLGDVRAYDEILQRARHAAVLASPRGEMSQGMSQDWQSWHKVSKVAIPTKIERVDDDLGGGLQKGRFGHVLGKKGGGKSHTLVHLSGSALEDGRRVMYVTLEMPGYEVRARHSRRLTGLNDATLSCLDPTIPEHKDIIDQLDEAHSRLTVLEATKRPLTVQGLIAALDRASSPPDLLVIDYAQILATGNSYSGKEGAAMRRADMGRVSQEIHNLAQERDIPIWTAYQANRTGMIALKKKAYDGVDVIDTTHYSESIEPSWHADVIMSVNQSDVERGTCTGRIYIADNRGGRSGTITECIMDWSTSKIEDLVTVNRRKASAVANAAAQNASGGNPSGGSSSKTSTP